MTSHIRLPDKTMWPHPDADHQWAERDKACAYDQLLNHPWGTEVSIQKIRWLRKAIREERKP